jgi:ketosteroid isomerase-like protein
MPDDVDAVRRLFAAVEKREFDSLLACYSGDIEINEAAVLPWGGVWRGPDGVAAHAAEFMRTWGALQGPQEARLDAQFFRDGEGTVCALFRHRAVDPVSGARFDAPEVGIYRIRNHRIVRSQMFHADSAAVVAFLSNAAGHGDTVAAQ